MEKRVEITCTPKELATVFSEWSESEQAQFFSEVEKLFQSFGDVGLQEYYLAKALDNDGTNFLYRAANYRKAREFRPGCHHEKRLLNSYQDF